ncbi:MAG: DNA repair protein RecN [Cyclobacteriaceae bacterium]|nr:DNA repair protein RecN [Cyclobacteriaceae bacterium HetDA_MAG_MS6]
MIKSLVIQNYALIDALEISPASTLNIITGETGAGKSIMLGAVGLLTGKRADTKVLWDDQKKCMIEGVFDIGDYNLQTLFDHIDIEYDVDCIIRREISPSGKSRAFVNDTPVTLDVLKSLGGHLLDIHSQHDSLKLGSNQYQLEVLDHYAGHVDLIEQYRKRYNEFCVADKKYQELLKKSAEAGKELDYQKFILKELEEANLDDLNQEEMEQELKVLENAEEIKLKLSQANQQLEESEFSMIDQLKELSNSLRSVATFSNSLNQLYERIEGQVHELKDIANELTSEADLVQHDPEKLATVKSQLDELYRLQQKHNTLELSELIELRAKLQTELNEVENLDEEITKSQQVLDQATKNLEITGKKLSVSRKKAAAVLAEEKEKIIHQIGIENGQVKVLIEATSPSARGLDDVRFYFSANKGVPPRELKEVASGGEFSRLIFALKYLIADKTALPTIIFDEIDTGVSGEIALRMIQMMRKMAKNHQVISISHLPQFAAGGDTHYFVYKDHGDAKSVSRIKKLESDERITAIARMIGGDNPSEVAFENARELLTHQ